ncbi:MAG: hypothetical protein OXG04_18295 [Acidobacteria bacterium]|nr:hypothetical protein [Acidobacteriota bacterium]
MGVLDRANSAAETAIHFMHYSIAPDPTDRPHVTPNASCAVALIDRLIHHVEVLRIEGRSFRRREVELSQQDATVSVRLATKTPNDAISRFVHSQSAALQK